ncbi:hypothetical protein BH20CHL6_BH20CHL6_12400 [soil metagenome]
MARRRLFVVLLTAAVGLVGVSPATGTETTGAVSDNSTVAIEEGVAWRAGMGLPREASHVAQVHRDATANTEFGLPLTEEEAAEIKTRIARQPAVTALRHRLEQLPGYAGLYIDHRAGGVVDVAVLADEEATLKAEVLRSAGELSVRIRTAVHSMSELKQIKSELVGDSLRLRTQGHEINTIGIDVPGNQVVVGVGRDVDRVEALLGEEWGPAVRVEYREAPSPGACSTRTNCLSSDPLRAGLSIHAVVGSSTYSCTSGFVARVTNSTNIVLITAGHCANTSPNGTIWRHNGQNIGATAANVQGTGWYTDVQYIDMPNSRVSNWRFVTNTVASIEERGDTNIGDVVYKSGISTGVTSGPVEDDSESYYLEGGLVADGVRAQVRFSYGDSGAPVYRATRAIGIGSAFDASGNFWFSHIDNTQNALRVTVCTTFTCS